MGRERDKIKLSNEDFMTLVPEDKKPYFETPLQDAKAGIQIRGLTKVRLSLMRNLSAYISIYFILD